VCAVADKHISMDITNKFMLPVVSQLRQLIIEPYTFMNHVTHQMNLCQIRIFAWRGDGPARSTVNLYNAQVPKQVACGAKMLLREWAVLVVLQNSVNFWKWMIHEDHFVIYIFPLVQVIELPKQKRMNMCCVKAKFRTFLKKMEDLPNQ